MTDRTKTLEDLNSEISELRKALSYQVGADAVSWNAETCCQVVTRFPYGVAIHDLNGNILLVNPAFCDYIGYTEEELLQMNVVDIDSNRAARTELGILWEKIERNDSVHIEVTHRRKDATVFPAEIFIAPIYFDGKKRIMTISRDLTEFKAWEFELQTSKAQLSNAVKIAQIGHWEYDVATNLFRFNDHFYSILGTTAAEVGGYEMTADDYASRFLHPDDFYMVARETKMALETDDPNYTREIEHRIIYPDGEIGYLLVRIFIVKDFEGRTIKTFGANQNITERKNHELEQRRLESQLIRSRRLETIGTLAGGIAHDFNNILTPILGYAEMALASLSSSDPLFEDFQEIRIASVRAKDLISKILTFSRSMERERQPLDLSVVIGEAMRLLRPNLPKGIEVRHIIEPDCEHVLADASEMHQVIVNLCLNAVHAMERDGGVVTIGLSRVVVDERMTKYHSNLSVGSYICLSVTDTGEGMDEETLDRIFEPFFTTRDINKGRGMGLSVVHGIVQSHYGEIVVQSERDKGSTFKIYLPPNR